MISSANYSDMTAALRIQWLEGFTSVPQVARQIYKVQAADGLTGYFSSIDGFTSADVKEEGDDMPYGTVTQGYRKTWTTYTVALMEKLTLEMRKGDRYSEMGDRIRGMGEAVAKRIEMDLTHRLTYATATSYNDKKGKTFTTTTGDGYALAYATHEVPGSATTYRNIISGNPVLSKGGLEAAELLLAKMIDDNGEPSPRTATHIIIGNVPSLINTAMEYIKSQSSPTVSNSGVINVYDGKYSLIILPFLTYSGALTWTSTYEQYWFLADLSKKRGILNMLQEPVMVPHGEDFETLDWKYGAYAMYAIEWYDGKNIIMSKGDGSA